MVKITQEELTKIKTYPLSSRKSIASRKDFGNPSPNSASLVQFIENLPNFYMAKDLRQIADRMVDCHSKKKVIHWSIGSHVIKNGLSRFLIEWIQNGWITTISFNGSALIHDFEIAHMGSTSEDVDQAIGEGKFGLAKETAEVLNGPALEGARSGKALGRSVGEWILKNTQFPEDSVLAQAAKANVAATVHIAVGTDITHIHPSFDVSQVAKASYRDFLNFASSVANLEGGMYFNVGSAVILPEIFLKAVSLVRNLGHQVENFWAVNFDFIRHYRPRRNVLERPTQKGGRAVEVIGPHELLIPLLHAATLASKK